MRGPLTVVNTKDNFSAAQPEENMFKSEPDKLKLIHRTATCECRGSHNQNVNTFMLMHRFVSCCFSCPYQTICNCILFVLHITSAVDDLRSDRQQEQHER